MPFGTEDMSTTQRDRLDGKRKVVAFYNSNHHPEGYRFVHVASPVFASPLVGISAGWLPGLVVSTDNEASQANGIASDAPSVRIRFHGWFCDPYRGSMESLEMMVPRHLVREQMETATDACEGESEAYQPQRPLLSILCVRWWDYWTTRWWSDYNVTSDHMLVDLFDGPCGVNQKLPGEYEVHTVFVRRSEDLSLVSDLWARCSLRGHQTVGWHFLWPTARAPGRDQRAGCVCERHFFDMLQRLERVGIRTCWPHPSQLYRLLCGKLWIAQMSLNTNYRVPATIRVHFQEFVTDPSGTAKSALEQLGAWHQHVWGDVAETVENFKGVAKLGFSWQGKDVVPFVGPEGLEQALRKLLVAEGSMQLICLVQRMVPSVKCELRALVFRDAKAGKFVWHKVYMRLWSQTKRGDAEMKGNLGFSLTSAEAVMPAGAAAEFFDGDVQMQLSVEKDVDALVERWLAWFAVECAEPPAATRIDFLVAIREEGQTPEVWTCEVGECGAALCGLEVDARNAAALNLALRHDQSGRFPLPLPEIKMRERFFGQ